MVQFSGIKYIHYCTAISRIHLRDSFHLAKLKLYPLNKNSHESLPPATGQHHSIFYLYEFNYTRYLILQSYSICLFCDWLISLRMSSDSSPSAFPSFLRLINSPLCGSIIYYCIHSSINGHWDSFGYYEPSHIFKLLSTGSLSSVYQCAHCSL